MREPGGAGGSTGDGSMCRGGVRVSEAGSGGEGYSSPSDAGGWQTSGARTVKIGGCQTTVVEAGAGVRAGIFKERALEVPFEEWVLEGTFEERALEDQRPPPCPAVPDISSAPPQPLCRERSCTLHSHRPRLAPLLWKLSLALAPGLV